jgi:Zn-dependent M28 family amino/carboxypeptidase
MLATVFAAACSPGDSSAGDSAAIAPALAAITADGILDQINVLAADDFEGRAPGTPGEDKTVEFLVNRFKELGLAPGNPDGTYIQNVSLIGFRTTPTLSMSTAAGAQSFAFPEDFVAVSRRNASTINVDASDVVFVGYGVVAPEYGWDDYKDVDVRGKTIVMLVNDPPVPLSDDSAQLDSAMFKGRAMTYYGRWTYKYEIASEKGAAAAIIVHETGPAGYPYDVVVGSWGQENFDVKTPGDNAGRVGVEAWMTLDKTRELFAAAGQNFDSLKAAAVSKDFRPVALDAKATFHLKTAVREIQSRNVIAKLQGADSVLRDEYVIYTAHWDHLGRDSTLDGDQIYNGALDNASGTSAMLEIAEAFTKLPEPPARSILFLAVTAEEKGLLGAKYYAENPLYPLNRTLADINMDGVNQWGRTRDLTVVGLGNSTLDDVLASVAAQNDRVIKPDAEPEKGFFYRSDHFEFAKKGVPALYIDAGTDFIDKPAGYGQEKRDEYTTNDYHKPSDEVKSDWDLSGAVEDAKALFQVGWRVAQGDRFPEWKAGTEFKAIREASLPAGDR